MLRPLHAVPESGEIPADAPSYGDLVIQNQKFKDHLASLLMKVGKLEAEDRREEEHKASAPAIKEVLEDWRPLCMPRAKIVANSPRWRKVTDRLKDRDEQTGELAYTPTDLKYATRGALLSKYHRDHKYLDAVTIFRDSGTVDQHLRRYWDWAFTPQGIEHLFNRVQRWCRAQGDSGNRLADALLSDYLEDKLEAERCGRAAA